MKKFFIVAALAVVAVTGAVLMMRRERAIPEPSAVQNTASPRPPIMPPTPFVSASPEKAEGALRELSVSAGQFAFEPSVLRAKLGERVRLTLTSVDVEHGIAIPDLGVNVKAPVGSPQSVEFTANKAGEFGLRCSVLCGQGHRDMTGTFIVEP